MDLKKLAQVNPVKITDLNKQIKDSKFPAEYKADFDKSQQEKIAEVYDKIKTIVKNAGRKFRLESLDTFVDSVFLEEGARGVVHVTCSKSVESREFNNLCDNLYENGFEDLDVNSAPDSVAGIGGDLAVAVEFNF